MLFDRVLWIWFDLVCARMPGKFDFMHLTMLLDEEESGEEDGALFDFLLGSVIAEPLVV
jgi:hypothetical protein